MRTDSSIFNKIPDELPVDKRQKLLGYMSRAWLLRHLLETVEDPETDLLECWRAQRDSISDCGDEDGLFDCPEEDSADSLWEDRTPTIYHVCVA